MREWSDISWQGIKRALSSGLRYAPINGAIFGALGGLYGLMFGLIGEALRGFINGLIVGAINGAIAALIGSLTFGLKAELKVKTYPNQGIWEMGIKMLMTIGSAMLLWPLIFMMVNWAMGVEPNYIKAFILGGLSGIWFGFMVEGAPAIIGHLLLRWMLFRRGRMPWNYADFLSEASKSGILIELGGCYRFYNDKLREYLADRFTRIP